MLPWIVQVGLHAITCFLIRRGRIWGHTPNMQCEEGEERDTAQPPEPKETRNEPSLTASGGSMVRSTLDYWTSGL